MREKAKPDLSFITSQKFENVAQYLDWFQTLDANQKLKVHYYATVKLSELIQCAEMLFDANVGNPDSIVFKVVSETLNAGK